MYEYSTVYFPVSDFSLFTRPENSTGRQYAPLKTLRGQRVGISRVCRRLLNSFTRNRRFELGLLLRGTTWSVYFTRLQIRSARTPPTFSERREIWVRQCQNAPRPPSQSSFAERRSFLIFRSGLRQSDSKPLTVVPYTLAKLAPYFGNWKKIVRITFLSNREPRALFKTCLMWDTQIGIQRQIQVSQVNHMIYMYDIYIFN